MLNSPIHYRKQFQIFLQKNILKNSISFNYIKNLEGRQNISVSLKCNLSVTLHLKNEALEIIGQFENLPRLVVFDLDYTLWPFYCECCYEDEIPYLYPHAKGILEALKEKGIHVAVASRSPTPDIAKTFLHKLGIHAMFVPMEIFSSWSHKTDHFRRIHRNTGVPFSSMLFFDDENRNIEAVSIMGVTSILVDNGINLDALRQGFSEFSQKSGSLSTSRSD